MENIGIWPTLEHTSGSRASSKTQHDMRLGRSTNQIRNLRGDVLACIGSKSEYVRSDSLLLTQLAGDVDDAWGFQSNVRIFRHINFAALRGRDREQTKNKRSQQKINSYNNVTTTRGDSARLNWIYSRQSMSGNKRTCCSLRANAGLIWRMPEILRWFVCLRYEN